MATVTITIQTGDDTLVKIGSRILALLGGGNGIKAEKHGYGNGSVAEAEKETIKSKAIELLKEGLTNLEVSQETGLPLKVVSAYKAHITMGTYQPKA